MFECDFADTCADKFPLVYCIKRLQTMGSEKPHGCEQNYFKVDVNLFNPHHSNGKEIYNSANNTILQM